MVDIVLINPPSIAVQNSPMPFGLAYMAAYLEKNGFSVKIFDLSVERMPQEELMGMLSKMKARTVGISCMSVHVAFVRDFSKKLKAKIPGVRVIVGGIHPTALTMESLAEMKDADVIVTGEGEITILDIMQKKDLSKIDGIAYMKNGKMVVNPPRSFIENLDGLPFPARHLLPPMERYSLSYDWEGRKPAATVFSSRGCPFNCIYCASKVMWKRRVRFRSAGNVLSEIDHLVKDRGVREILFYDDHFTLNKERLYEICNGIIERGYDLSWCCLSRVDSIDMQTARLMRKAGCHMISFGVESGSQEVLDAMHKGVKVQQIVDAFRTCRQAGINTKASFIFGGPRETKKTVRETRALIGKILPDYVWFFIMTPMPGTELYRLHQESGMVCDEWSMYDQTTYTRFYGTEMTYEELRKAVFESYRGYYLSAPYVFSMLSKLSYRKVRVALQLAKRLPVALKYMRRGREK